MFYGLECIVNSLPVAFAMSFGNNDPAMKHLHQHMEAFLNDEETALEERIM